MWFERDLPRLNVLLELLGEWVRVGTHGSLFALLGRVKWVVSYSACFVAIDTPSEEAEGEGVFEVRGGTALRTLADAVPAPVARVLASIRAQRRIFAPADGPLKIVGAPLVADGSIVGAIVFVARDTEPYSQHDVRFVEVIADYFAGAWWRISMREREQQQILESRRKDDFLALLGHELRNPLAPMVTALELMNTGKEHTREREILKRQVRHMTRLVDDLMDVARIARGKLEITRRPAVLRDVLASALETAAPALETRNHRVLVEQGEAIAISGDVGRISQILVNLLTNAGKFSASGSVVRVRVESADGRVRVLVVDEGEGIASRDLQKVFLPFVQLGDRGLDRPGGGLGLGLSVARELARAHGGDLSVRSEGSGRGATFVLELPIAATEETAPELTPSPRSVVSDTPARRRARVLLVDDNVDAAEMLTCMLEAKGFDVRVAYDGESALVETEDFEPDLGILDIGLPGMNGYELAAALRRDSSRAHAPDRAFGLRTRRRHREGPRGRLRRSPRQASKFRLAGQVAGGRRLISRAARPAIRSARPDARRLVNPPLA